MAVYKAGPYEIQVVRHESVGAPSALVTVYRRKAFVEMSVAPVEGLDVAGLKRRVLSLRGCRALELGAVVREARSLAGMSRSR